MTDGIITKGIGGFYYVSTPHGSYQCRARGKLRKDKIIPVVGDRVKISIVNESQAEGVIEQIQPRVNYLIRPPLQMWIRL
jgi:ribosome biogenesis GTPase